MFRNNILDITGAAKLGIYQDCPAIGNFGMGNNVFECNIVYSAAPPPSELWDFYVDTAQAPASVRNNVYWGTQGQLPNGGGLVDSNPVYADPHFADPAAGDYAIVGAPPIPCFVPISGKAGPLPH